MATPKTVFVIDDHPVVLKGLRELLGSSKDFQLVGESLSGDQGVGIVDELKPNLVVLDLRLPDGMGPEFCRRILALSRSTKVVILTAFDDTEPIEASLQAGASGVLLKDLHDVDMLQAFRDVLAGEIVIDARVKGGELASRSGRKAKSLYGPLTPREYEVLRLLAQGMTSKEIATELSLTTNTVRGYAQTLIVKLQANTRLEALATARRLRLI